LLDCPVYRCQREELIFHGCHSGLVFLIGLFLMLKGLTRQQERE